MSSDSQMMSSDSQSDQPGGEMTLNVGKERIRYKMIKLGTKSIRLGRRNKNACAKRIKHGTDE